MIPGLGTLACFLLSYFKVYRPLSMLRIRETQHKALCQAMRRWMALDFAVGILFPVGPFIRLYFCNNLRMAREAQYWVFDHADRYTRAINQANASSNDFSSSYSSSIHSPVPSSSYSYYTPYSSTSYPTTSASPFTDVGAGTGATSKGIRPQRIQISRASSAISAPARLEQQHRLYELTIQKESNRQRDEMRPVEEWMRRLASAVECRNKGADSTTGIGAVESKMDDNIKLDVVEVCEDVEGERDAMSASVTVATTVSTSATAAVTTGTMETIITRDLGSLPPLGFHPRRKKNLNAYYKKPSASSTLTGSCEYDSVGGHGNNQSTNRANSSATGITDSSSAAEQVQDPRRHLLRTYHSDQDLVFLANVRLHGRQHQRQDQNQCQCQFQSQYNFQSRPVMISPHFRNKDVRYTGPVLAHSTSPLNLLSIHNQYRPLQNNESVGHETEGTQSQTHTQQQTQSKTQERSQDEQQQQPAEQRKKRSRQKTKRRSARESRSGGVPRSRSTASMESMHSNPGTAGSSSNMHVSASATVVGDGIGIVDNSGNDTNWLNSQNQITESHDNQQQEQGDVSTASVCKTASAAHGTPPKLMRGGSVQTPQRLKPTATPNQEALLPLLKVSQAREEHHHRLLPEERQQEQQGLVGLVIDMGGRTNCSGEPKKVWTSE
ncbi:hypothetical protein EDD21DRAFT_403624 [Dissophora ornata]|nr:hypothetical protein EDD21DRAFT_403624 [Dissophora ornata]